MTSTTKRLLVAGAALAATAIAGCAHTLPTGPARGTADLSPTDAGPLTKTITYSGTGITLAPPNGRAAMISSAKAFAACSDNPCPTSAAPTIYLASATTDSMGKIQPDGSAQPTIVNRLAYAMIWIDVPCSRSGGTPVPAGSTAPSPVKYKCLAVALIDATTGQFLAGAQTNAAN
jgi:hypothetical protein